MGLTICLLNHYYSKKRSSCWLSFVPDDVADSFFVVVNNIPFKLRDDSVKESNLKYGLAKT